MKPIQITFYTRPGCCLCDQALQTLRELEPEFGLEIETKDISTSPELLRSFSHRVPVATMQGEEIFCYHADRMILRGLFASQRCDRQR